NLGRCSITQAELTGAVVGLDRAWQLGFRNVELQLDSTTALSILHGPDPIQHQHAGLVLRFRRLIARDWRVRIIRVYREGNRVADFLANLGHNVNVTPQFYEM
ncbi:Putative ribonuclease H protein At1g65750, partial [Linum perenne]